MGPVSPIVAAALADRLRDAVESSALTEHNITGTRPRAAPGDFAAMTDQVLLARRTCSYAGQEFAITRELRRRFLLKVDGGA